MNFRTTCFRTGLTASILLLAIAGGPLCASEADDRIEASFKSSHVAQTFLKSDSVKVASKDGVVVLSGTVADAAHKSLAEDTAAGLPGVTRVDNQLVTAAAVSTDSADSWIARKVKLALLFHSNVNATATTVTVKEGVVTLSGEAASVAQKDLTGEYAKDIDGVKEVKNELLVVAVPPLEDRTAGQKLDDASITAEVRTALLTHRSTSQMKTQVNTHNGEVSLTGIAQNRAERDLVTKLVTGIHGVSSVKNQMTLN